MRWKEAVLIKKVSWGERERTEMSSQSPHSDIHEHEKPEPPTFSTTMYFNPSMFGMNHQHCWQLLDCGKV